MPRATRIVSIPGQPSDQPGSRDNGKSFFIEEMPSRRAEKWASRAFLALAESRVDLPPGIGERARRAKGNMQDVYNVRRLLANVSFPELEPLVDELMGCVSFLVNPKPDVNGRPTVRPLHDAGDDNDDIQEIATRHFLRSEVIDLHVGFSGLPAAVLNLIAVGSTTREMTAPTTSPTTRTSRQRSPSS